ncbi:MAG: hypothetical protein D9V47_04600 [Clostridia bacterium]|nr:MAG: hypothetical protein D9V47_04600 [Clostridia bacterium]
MHIVFLSALAGLATCAGSLLVLASRRASTASMAVATALACGAMLAVVGLDLLPAALHLGGLYHTVAGFTAGLALIWLLDRLVAGRPGRAGSLRRAGYLAGASICLHDVPEGVAIAAGYAVTSNLGLTVLLAMAMHNIPEGMAVAGPLRLSGLKFMRIMGISLGVSLATPLGASLGLMVAGLPVAFVALTLALAGGAMVFVVYRELLPATLRLYPFGAWLGFGSGLLLVGVLSRALNYGILG